MLFLLYIHVYMSNCPISFCSQVLEQQYSDLQPAVSEAMRQASLFAAQAQPTGESDGEYTCTCVYIRTYMYVSICCWHIIYIVSTYTVQIHVASPHVKPAYLLRFVPSLHCDLVVECQSCKPETQAYCIQNSYMYIQLFFSSKADTLCSWLDFFVLD